MLPFLDSKKMTSVIMAKSKPSGEVQDEPGEDSLPADQLSCAQDFLDAVSAGDPAQVVNCLKDLLSALSSNE